MDNVYDVKKEKKLNYILPLKQRITSDNCLKKVAIIIHLHYLDTLQNYFRYIQNIPVEIDIFITTSDEKVKDLLNETSVGKRKNCKIIMKQNRGRDISAFLVACREDILTYDYVCFLHDKKEKTDDLKLDTEMWIRELWENTIGSAEYIANVQSIFEQESQIGLLVPPLPMSDHCATAYANTWGKDFLLTKDLAMRLQLVCDLNVEKPPIALGTVFWTRVEALRKLFEIDWKYEDFDEEPLKDDGTISHAIERILPYLAQDAGYETGWIMNDQYAGEQFEYTQAVLRGAFAKLRKSLGVWYIAELNSFDERKRNLLEFVDKYEYVYIYGAGEWGRSCLAMLRDSKRAPTAFLVSNPSQNPQEIEGISVYSLADIALCEKTGVIIAVNKMQREEILTIIKEKQENFSALFFFERE